MIKTAHFSEDRAHRYQLQRIWNYDQGLVLFIGLNPSNADEKKDDPTIRRVIRFAEDWGYGGVVMCNLFTTVTPYPNELDVNKFTDLADWAIRENAERCDKIICAWGSFKEARLRGLEVLTWLGEVHALQINKNGSPKHPLYVRADTVPVKYRPI